MARLVRTIFGNFLFVAGVGNGNKIKTFGYGGVKEKRTGIEEKE